MTKESHQKSWALKLNFFPVPPTRGQVYAHEGTRESKSYTNVQHVLEIISVSTLIYSVADAIFAVYLLLCNFQSMTRIIHQKFFRIERNFSATFERKFFGRRRPKLTGAPAPTQ